MPVQKTCEQCSKVFHVPKTRGTSARFCSRACRDKANRSAERRVITCNTCKNKFETAKDHDIWPKFCSRSCFAASALPPKEKECAACGSLFLAVKSKHESPDGYRIYCSFPCKSEGARRGSEHACIHCGSLFWMRPSALLRRGEARCCSTECRNAFYAGVNSPAFKSGFYTDSTTNIRHVLLKRPGYVGKYMAEHRVVASKAIGRLVTRSEFVIRVNRNPNDNRPDNLFICTTNSEFSRRRNGSLPWPTQSNLSHFVEKGESK